MVFRFCNYKVLCSVTSNDVSVTGQLNMHVTFNPHVNCGSNGKHKQEEDEDESLQIVCCNSLHTKQDGPEQFTLKAQWNTISLLKPTQVGRYMETESILLT